VRVGGGERSEEEERVRMLRKQASTSNSRQGTERAWGSGEKERGRGRSGEATERSARVPVASSLCWGLSRRGRCVTVFLFGERCGRQTSASCSGLRPATAAATATQTTLLSRREQRE